MNPQPAPAKTPERPAHAGQTTRRLLIAWPLLAALSLALPLTLPGQPRAADAAPLASASKPDAFEQAQRTFSHASAGDNDAIEPALAQFTALMQAHPGDPLMFAYAGAATTLQARTTYAPWKKMRYSEDGLALIDKALALLGSAPAGAAHRGVPAALEVKLTAANTFLALPGLFNRGERGRRLIDELQKDPAYPATPAGFQDAVRRVAAKGAP